MHDATPPLLLQTRQLCKDWDGHPVLRSLDLQIRRGDVIGLLGKNGAGKTTLMETLLGFSPASSGEVTLFGEPATQLSAASKHRIGYVAQEDDALAQLSATQYLDLIARFYAHWDGALVDRLLQEWQIPTDTRIQKMSVGQKQKLSILSSLGHAPELLILDEPVASLDPIARRQFLQTLIDIVAQGDRTVIFSTHIVSDLERIANRVWILADGHLQWDGELDALKESVVRLHLRSNTPLDPALRLPGQLRCEHQGSYARVVVRDFSEETLAIARRKTGAEIEVESLGLEDIFLELQA